MTSAPSLHVPVHPVRFVTAASLFDGHDAAINIMRRVLQSQGAEVVHLGHDRSVEELVTAAIQEDVQGVAVSSYQGGHMEYFSYLVQRLRERGAGHVQVFGGGGGVIVPDEIALLAQRGVRVFAPEDGQRLGLAGMINTLVKACDVDLSAEEPDLDALVQSDAAALARAITVLEAGRSATLPALLRDSAADRRCPVLGITGTGGSGKSSLTDELVRRLRMDNEDKLRVAVLAIDPTRRRGGGALLGDRIRMNALEPEDPSRIFFRSIATRGAAGEVPGHLDDAIWACKAAGYDLVIVETPGIGQGDAGIVEHCDVSLYVMTPEYGAASQLEKIDMLDFADVVAVNKFERRGGEDARRDVARQLVRNREAFGVSWEEMPVYGTSRCPVRRRRRDRPLPAPEGPARGARARGGRRSASTGDRPHLLGIEQRDPSRAGPLPLRRERDGPALSRSAPAGWPKLPAAASTCDAQALLQEAWPGHRRSRPAARAVGRRSRCADEGGLGGLARARGVVRRRGTHLRRPGKADRDSPSLHHAFGQLGGARGATAHPRRGRAGALPALGEPAGQLPVHRRRVPLQARPASRPRACSPAKGTPSAPTGASSCSPAGHPRPGCPPPSTR